MKSSITKEEAIEIIKEELDETSPLQEILVLMGMAHYFINDEIKDN